MGTPLDEVLALITDEYLARVPEDQQALLDEIREVLDHNERTTDREWKGYV